MSTANKFIRKMMPSTARLFKDLFFQCTNSNKKQTNKKPRAMCNFKTTITPAKQILNHFLNGFIYIILIKENFKDI